MKFNTKAKLRTYSLWCKSDNIKHSNCGGFAYNIKNNKEYENLLDAVRIDKYIRVKCKCWCHTL